ncbi:spore gernimation protein [Peribacillus muralis]|uniref:Spore gernimation protein n=1 Tax=Peribacillus muralis TaxID=264697 RepID=A0A1B3XTT2_9BACI|nr:spore germination protein [Peribacillus muralis]AOH56629.1 spore gernimation protein [Peribacillus muralis]
MAKAHDHHALLTKEGLYQLFQAHSDVRVSSKVFNHEDMDRQEVLLVYTSGMVDSMLIYDTVLPAVDRLIKKGKTIGVETLDHLLAIEEIKPSPRVQEELSLALFSGNLLLFDCQTSQMLSINVAKMPQRSIDESNMEVSIRGPRDGFIENSEVNIALIRQRLKTTALANQSYTLGTRSNTNVNLLYMEDVINPDVLRNIQLKLSSLQIDTVTSSYQIEELLYDQPFSIFPLVDYSGRPDYVVESLNQGRFAIMVDGSPSCLLGPVNMTHLLKTPEDNQVSFLYVSAERVLRILAFVTTIFLPGFWTGLTSYQLDQLPFPLMATVSVSRNGLPIAGPLELFIMLVFFELFKEAGVRLPKAVGQTVAVLGGLIIGDAAIRAGLTSPSTLVIGAITVISGYTLVNQNLAGNVLLIRFFILGISSIMGLYGFFLGVFFIFIALAGLESFGHPYLASFYKLNTGDVLKSIIKIPYKYMKTRNEAYSPMDPDRKKE